MNRRGFIGTLIGAPALIGLARKAPRVITGGFAEDGMAVGHDLRDHRATTSTAAAQRIGAVIVGGGIAGLSAAWELERRGMHDFVLLELASQPGGNARSGANEVSAYPWAAHYVPVPGSRATLVRELFEELGVLRDGQWEERHLCFSPQERLFVHGEWHAGIEPEFAISARERDEMQRFEELVAQARSTGEFTIPSALGVKRTSSLDTLSMAEWLRKHDLNGAAIQWYVDYACRDDYGARAKDVSAWAGVHYFASREPDEKGPLTWPEGNGWIVKRLAAKLERYIRTRSPVTSISRSGSHWLVDTPTGGYRAEAVIFAAPAFVAPYIVQGLRGTRSSFVYSPWLTANLTLDRGPRERGIPAAWDNVIYDSPALGYVVATHQSLRTVEERTVWTFYWALADGTPEQGRQLLAARDWSFWRDRILADLERAHPDIRDCVSHIDVMRHGHAMIRPTVGFLTATERTRARSVGPRFYFAHSDRSGLSLFEEAQYEGVTAARRVLA